MTVRTAVLSLRLNLYRSYRAAAIATDGRSVALYGPNGAGKTNVLEALSLLTPGRGLRRAGTEELVRRPDNLGWKVRAEVATATGVLEIATEAAGPDAPRTVTIDDKRAPQVALGRHVRMVWLTPAMDRLWTDGAADRRRFLDRMTLGFEPAHADAAIAYEKAMRQRNRLLKDGHGDDHWLSALEGEMARHGARMARARAEALARLQNAQNAAPETAKSLFPKADLAILGDMETRFHQVIRDRSAPDDDLTLLEIEEAAGLARRLADARGRDAQAGRTLDGPHRSDLDAVYAAKAMPARACSTGEQKALLISLCLANARALAEATGAAPILLLDEVAAHLDGDRRRALYGEIAALGCQAWMTGTGAELFDGLADARRIAVGESDGVSTLSPEAA